MKEEDKIDIGIDKHKILKAIQPKDVERLQSRKQPGSVDQSAAKLPAKSTLPKTSESKILHKVNVVAPVVTISIATLWLILFLSTGSPLALGIAFFLYTLQALLLVLEFSRSSSTAQPPPEQQPSR